MTIFSYRRLKLWLLFIYFFSQPFLYWDPLGVRSSFSVPAFAFLLYLVIMILKPLENLNFKSFVLPGGALFFLWLLFEFHNIFETGGFHSDIGLDVSFLQTILMIWLVQSHLYKDDSALLFVGKAVAASCILTVVIISLGIGLMSQSGDEYYGRRLYFFGMNPNQLGNIAALGLIFSSLFVLETLKESNWLQKALLIITVGCCLYILTFAASRGAILAFALPVLLAFALSNLKFYKRAVIIIVAILGISIFILFVADISFLVERFTNDSSVNSLGGRTGRWKAAFDIFFNWPLFGVGESGYKILTVSKYGFSGSPHNSYLQVMAYGGIVGLLLFLIPILYAARISIAAYRKTKKTSAMALLLFFVLIMSKDGGALNSAFNWSILALSMGVALNLLDKKGAFRHG